LTVQKDDSREVLRALANAKGKKNIKKKKIIGNYLKIMFEGNKFENIANPIEGDTNKEKEKAIEDRL
jgi:hypothetical protein